MKSVKEIGPSRAMRWRSLSASPGTRPHYIFAMRRRALGTCLVAATFLSPLACATRREPLPTLEDYSDGVSVFAEKLLESWKTADGSAAFFGSGFAWSGPLPGDGMSRIPTRAGWSLEAYRRGAGPQTGQAGAEDLVRRLERV